MSIVTSMLKVLKNYNSMRNLKFVDLIPKFLCAISLRASLIAFDAVWPVLVLKKNVEPPVCLAASSIVCSACTDIAMV